MESEENSYYIHVDLIIEILSKLPAKSIARFRCVSKLWGSTLCCPYFTDLFLTMSRARPRILLAIKPDGNDPWQFYLLPQPQLPLSRSHVVVADFHMKFLSQQISIGRVCGYASGLICLSGISKDYGQKLVIYNLSTGQYAMLPKLTNHNHFLGFDPVNKQFKVLSMGYNRDDHDHDPQILTLGDGELSWRKIKCPLAYKYGYGGICINGVLYYLVAKIDNRLGIVYFDVRSEEFRFITPTYFNSNSVQLINYKGKLGTVSWNKNHDFEVWVLKDVEKHEWSKYVYTLPADKVIGRSNVFVAGVTTTGEIVLSMSYLFTPFYVFYFNPERNTLQTVEILGNHRGDHYDQKRVYIFVDHVEDLKFNIRNETSIILPEQKRKPTSTLTSSKEERRTFESKNKTPIAISPPEQKHRPKSISTSTPSRKHHQQHHQHKQSTFESTNKFDALYLLDDDV